MKTCDDPYTPPECLPQRLNGKAFGHPRFADGLEVTTSPIVGSEGEVVITYSGSRYRLGSVDLKYEKEFPDARNRVFKSLAERTMEKVINNFVNEMKEEED